MRLNIIFLFFFNRKFLVLGPRLSSGHGCRISCRLDQARFHHAVQWGPGWGLQGLHYISCLRSGANQTETRNFLIQVFACFSKCFQQILPINYVVLFLIQNQWKCFITTGNPWYPSRLVADEKNSISVPYSSNCSYGYRNLIKVSYIEDFL